MYEDRYRDETAEVYRTVSSVFHALIAAGVFVVGTCIVGLVLSWNS